jgi:DNA-binding SARP family transcriptional activator/tetratricopeptide (TPR) repeat protein
VTHHFVLHCLGGPALFTVAGEQVRFRTRKHFALLIRLALDAGKQFTRDYLADLLWPDAAPKFANHSLAQGLSVIKAKIARDAVVIQRATVGLAAGWIDVDALHLTDGGARIAGPFLEGFEIPTARPFEEWKDEHRARLTPQMRDCLVRLMDAARRIGDFATVEGHATKLQELDPLSEEGIRGVMEARAWASDRSSALKAFARYEARLAEELGAKPGADLVRMADLLRDGRRTPRPAVAGYPPPRVDRRFEPETLIGREREFSVLYDAWLEARRKNPRIVVVTSDPGVGKTTLVNAFASTCQMDGAVVARAQAYDAERELPFAVLGELVKQLAVQRAIGSADPEALSELTRISSEILRAFPGVPKPVEWSPELTPLRIADAFLKTITAAATGSPILLVVDDIHAADNASTAIIHSLARKLEDTRVLMILAARTSELRLSGAPWALTSDQSIASLRSLELEVLPTEAAERVITRLAAAGSTLHPPTDRILRASGRNPLALELITREWAEHGDASLLRDLEALDTQPVPVIGIPPAIATVFDRQSRRLESSIRATLDLAAVLGRRLTEMNLYSAIDLSPGQAAEALSRLRDEGYLREVSGDLEFRNELIRAQAYYAVAGATRQHLHRRVASLLVESHSDEDKTICLEIAWHHLRGADVAGAVPYALEGAAAVLAVGAPHGAQEILQAILSLGDVLAKSKRLRLLLAKALIDQSKGETAVPIIEQLSSEQGLDLVERAEVAMLRASAEFQVNRESGSRYAEAAGAALEAAQQTGESSFIAKALFECARAAAEEGRSNLMHAAEEGIDALAQKTDVTKLPMAITTKAFCRFSLGYPSDALDQLEQYLQLRSAKPNAAELALIHSGMGTASYYLGRTDDALRSQQEGLNFAKRVGDDARASIIAANLCTVHMSRGDYHDSIRYGEMSVRYGEASSSSGLLICYTNLIDPYVLVGRYDAALECLEKARRWLAPERRWKLRLTFVIEAASYALLRGNVGLALDLIGQMEGMARGREDMVLMPGVYWKMRTFRMGHVGQSDEAYASISARAAEWRTRAVFHYLDMLAAKSWLEMRENGKPNPETSRDLWIFDTLGLKGRRELLTLQGFLPTRSPATIESIESTTSDGRLKADQHRSRSDAHGHRPKNGLPMQ